MKENKFTLKENKVLLSKKL